MAIPNPEHELARARKLAAAGLPPCTVVAGPADFFRGEALAILLAAVPPDADLRTVDGLLSRGLGGNDDDDDGDDSGADAGSDAAAAPPAVCPDLEGLRGRGLFAARTCVVVRRGEAWLKRYGTAVAEALPRIGKGCSLIIETRKFDRRKKLAKLVDAAALLEFRDLYDSPYDRTRSPLEAELVGWLVARSRAAGVALSPEAAFLVVTQVGKSPAELVAELQRLQDQFGADGKRKPLQPDDLRGKLSCLFESTPFEFAEALLGGDRRRAFRSLRAMFDRAVRARDGGAMDPGGVFPFLTNWTFQSLLQTYEGRVLLDDGVPLRDLAGRLSVRNFADRFAAQVQKNDAARLRAGMLALLHCQRQLRLTGEEPDLLLEQFLRQWFDGATLPPLQESEL
jgi:DNA polymerase III delta subunit